MAQLAPKLLTFEEFAELNSEGRYELVNGRLEELVAPRPWHSWTGGRLYSFLDAYLSEHDPEGFWGIELDIPTIPHHGRRPDIAYYSARDAGPGLDLRANVVLGSPTLVVEVVSPDDEARDTVTKRREYAKADISHYWIVDTVRRSALTLELVRGAYETTGEFFSSQHLVSSLLPDLNIPLDRLFR